MIRVESGMPTSRFTHLIGVPERSYRRWQARARAGQPVKGPWPTPEQDRVQDVLTSTADAWPAWGHRKIADIARADGLRVTDSTAYRCLRRAGRVLEIDYAKERRDLAAERKAAFWVPPSGRNQVWQLDFTEFETSMGGVWRIAGCTDYWSKYELGWNVTQTQNHRDAITAIEIAIREAETLLGCRLVDELTDPTTGEVRPIAVVTDNGPAFKANRFRAFIDARPEFIHIRTRRKSPGQNGVRERAFGTLKYEHLYRTDIPDGPTLAAECETYRHIFNQIRPHQGIGRCRPTDRYLAPTGAESPTQNEPETLPTS